MGFSSRLTPSTNTGVTHGRGRRVRTQGDNKNSGSNRDLYELPAVVADYRDLTKLQLPEQSIIRALHAHSSAIRMLDIGVGGGRTTLHFAPLVQRYVGIDYSAAMIDACRARFGVERSVRDFFVADARYMGIFKDAEFDFALFSFNGIDCIEYEERGTVLAEVRRVCRPGGHFAFSTHNIRALHKVYRFRIRARPQEWKYEVFRFIRFRYYNGTARHLTAREHAMVTDSAEGFRLRACHIAPETQTRQLEQLGFRDVRTFSIDGEELSRQAAAASHDPWLYFLATV
jgi:ubiquinone/menaquinone biosynthesis C-methylase UbiE